MNSHIKYQTKAHHHLDWSYKKGDGQWEYPHSALMLVQAGDDRWFLEQEFGNEYGRCDGVLKSPSDLDTVPVFYADVEQAARAAFAMMKQVHPGGFDDKELEEFLADD